METLKYIIKALTLLTFLFLSGITITFIVKFFSGYGVNYLTTSLITLLISGVFGYLTYLDIKKFLADKNGEI